MAVQAQQPAPPAGAQEPNWDVIKGAALSPIDRQIVQKWTAAQIEQILGSPDPGPPGGEFYRKIGSKTRDAAPVFKEAVGQIIAETLLSRYQQAAGSNNRPKPLGTVFILMALRETGPPPASLPAFRIVLTDPAPAVRCQGMAGINVLRAGVTGQARQGLAQEIQKAAAAESYPIVLERMYDFLQFAGNSPSPPVDLAAAARLIMDTLDARLTRIEKEGGWPAPADADAVVWLLGKAKAAPLNTTQSQANIARLAGRLLANAALTYAETKPPEQIKLDLERTVLLVEPELAQLTSAKAPNAKPPAPSLADQVAGNQKAKMAQTVTMWIGSGQTKGVLNEAFNLPPGLGMQRSAPATAPAPAS